MTDTIKQFIIIWPEITLIFFAIFGQLFSVLFNSKIKVITNIVIILVTLFFLTWSQSEATAFNNSFVINGFIKNAKIFVWLCVILTIIIYNSYCQITNEQFKPEFITLILLSTAGAFISVSARNFLLLFCAMELQALIGYVLAGFSLHNIRSSEGALKYFILGSLVTCLSLLGMSFIYGFGGSLEYSDIYYKLNNVSQQNIGLLVGLILFLSGIFFKLSSAPLHIWTPDVYEGSPLPSVTYFVTATKIANVVILLNIMTMVVGAYKPISVNLVKIVAILSMLIGAFGAVRQTSLKRLMGYATILNIGYVLMGIALPNHSGNAAALTYIIIYAFSVIGFFSCIIFMLGKKSDTATFEDIRGLAATHKVLSGGILLIVFSMIGIPPLAGFFGKYFIFYQAIVEQQFVLAFVGIGISVIAAYYYLKIVKYMYFFKPTTTLENDLPTPPQGLQYIIGFMIGFLVFFSILVDVTQL